MNKLTWHDLQFALIRVPKLLLKTMKLPAWKNRVFVGGGFLRSIVTGDPVNDVDIFVPDLDTAEALAVELVCQRVFKKDHNACSKEEFESATKRIYRTDNALTLCCFSPVLQIIHRWTFDSPAQVITSFDFTCCAAVFWWDGEAWDSVCDDRFYPDVAAKRLVYRLPDRNEDAGGSMLRVLKYYQKGYRIPLDSLAAVIGRLVAGVNFKKINMKRLTMEDTRIPEFEFSRIICGLLREVDPAIDPKHVAHLPAENTTDAPVDSEPAEPVEEVAGE